MNRLGVIPAAGNGERWGGYYKELLPCGVNEWLLDRTARAMVNGGADALLIVTRPDKVAAHAAHMARFTDVPVYYAMQRGNNDIWSAIEESFGYPADDYLFAMPDTYFPLDAFPKFHIDDFTIWLFETETPERFGVVVNGQVTNKQQLPPGTYEAWGLLSWTAETMRFWQDERPANYTSAINLCLAQRPYSFWPLDYYHDFATYEDYQRWTAAQ